MKNGIIVKSISTLAAASLVIGSIGAFIPEGKAYADEGKAADIVKASDINVISDKELDRRSEKLSGLLLADAGQTKKDDGIDKDETVYVFSGADGTQKNIIVSDWLKNPDGAATLTDSSNLSDITNVKGDEKFTQSGEDVTWEANGSDIYYQGTTTEKAPIDVKVSYKLDGNDIAPADLAGKSGKVTIRFDYTNNAVTKAKIGDTEDDIAVPFTVITGMILPEDKFSNIEVTNGKVISEGKNATAIGVTFPGLKDSLDLDDDSDIPEYFEVTADVTDFELEMTLSCALPDIISNSVDTDNGKIQDIKDALDKLSDGKEDLQNGVNDLKDGTAELRDKSADLSDGVDKLDDGAGDLKSGAKKVRDGAKDLKDGAKQVSDGTGKLSDGADKLSTGAASLKKGANDLKAGVNKISAGAGTLAGGLDQASSGAAALATGSKDLAPSAKQISDGAAAVDKGVNTLAGTISTIGTSIQTQIGTIDAQIADYKGKMGQLVQGYGSEEAIASNPKDWAAYNQMKGAVGALTAIEDGLKQQSAGLMSEDSQNQLKALVAGADQLAAGSQKFTEAVGQIPAGLKSLSDALSKLYKGSLDLKNGADSAAAGADKLAAGADSLAAGANTLKTGVGTLNTGAKKLYTGTGTLYNGTKDLYNGTSDLKDGTVDLKDGTGKLIDGIGDLDDGAGDLKDGVDELIDKLSDKDSTEIIDRLDAVSDAGKDYTTFTKLSDGQSGSVKFIIKTDSIKKADE